MGQLSRRVLHLAVALSAWSAAGCADGTGNGEGSDGCEDAGLTISGLELEFDSSAYDPEFWARRVDGGDYVGFEAIFASGEVGDYVVTGSSGSATLTLRIESGETLEPPDSFGVRRDGFQELQLQPEYALACVRGPECDPIRALALRIDPDDAKGVLDYSVVAPSVQVTSGCPDSQPEGFLDWVVVDNE